MIAVLGAAGQENEMLKIEVRYPRGTDKYVNVTVDYGGLTLDLGMLDAAERRQLAAVFEQAQDELLERLERSA